MKSIFKGIAKGILYFIAFPAIILGIALYCVFALFVFLFQFGKLVYLFFTGRTLFSDLDEDIKAKEILAKMNGIQDSQNPNSNISLSLYPSDSSLYGNEYSSSFANNEDKNQTLEEPKEDEDNVD